MEECCGEVLWRNVVVKCCSKVCGEVLWRSVAEKCCGKVL